MTSSKATIAGAGIVGLAILANLGYSIARDRSAAETFRLEELRQSAAAADLERRRESKNAWEQSLKFIDVEFEDWLRAQAPNLQGGTVSTGYEWVKSYSAKDVRWTDPYHVTVQSILGAAPPHKAEANQFAWSRDLEYCTDGVNHWWSAKQPRFVALPDSGKQPTYTVRMISNDNHATPLAR